MATSCHNKVNGLNHKIEPVSSLKLIFMSARFIETLESKSGISLSKTSVFTLVNTRGVVTLDIRFFIFWQAIQVVT